MQEDYIKIPTNNDLKECLVLGGIDTLYSFVDTTRSVLYHSFYANAAQGLFNRIGYTYLGHSGKSQGFVGTWYSFNRGGVLCFRIGFKNPEKQKQVKNIQLQLYASGIYYFGFLKLLDFIKDELKSILGVSFYYDDFITSRVDLNCFVDGFDFSQINADMFRSRFVCDQPHLSTQVVYDLDSTYSFSKLRRLQTLYLGSRQNSLYFKIYDKKLEMLSKFDEGGSQSFQASVKNAYLHENGLRSDHLWNIEFTIKREALKQFGLFSVADLIDKGNSVFKILCSSCAFLGFDTEKILAYKKSKHVSRLAVHPIWQKIIDEYDFFAGVSDAERIYKKYKNITKEKSSFIIAKQISKQVELDQNYTFSEWNDLFRNYEKYIS